MRSTFGILLCLWLLVPMGLVAQRIPKPVKLKPLSSVGIQVHEPSDIAFGRDRNSFFVVSDNGYLAETDLEGKLLRKAAHTGYDFEGVLFHGGEVFVVDEMSRRVHVYDAESLTHQRTHQVPYSGGRNKSYESIVYNPVKGKFILITEKEPVYIFELDSLFRKENEIEWKWKVGDISSATFHDGHLWLLSDEDRLVMRCDPKTYEVKATYLLPVINPEGFAFISADTFVVVSDDMERMYRFKIPAP